MPRSGSSSSDSARNACAGTGPTSVHNIRATGNGWKQRGLPGIAAYWRAFFAAEPGAVVQVQESDRAVVLEVAVCPALLHLRRISARSCRVSASTAIS